MCHYVRHGEYKSSENAPLMDLMRRRYSGCCKGIYFARPLTQDRWHFTIQGVPLSHLLVCPIFGGELSRLFSIFMTDSIGISGATHSSGKYVTGDDDVIVNITLQMADPLGAVDGKEYDVSVGVRMHDLVQQQNATFTVTRLSDEKPSMLLSATVGNDTTKYVICMVGTTQYLHLALPSM